MLGLFGTTTPPKFILSHISSHISYIPHSQPPLCLAYHLSLAPRWISFTTSWHTCLLVKMFALRLVLQLSLNFNEMLLDFFGGGVFLVEWNVSKCVRAEKSKERGRGRGSISRLRGAKPAAAMESSQLTAGRVCCSSVALICLREVQSKLVRTAQPGSAS